MNKWEYKTLTLDIREPSLEPQITATGHAGMNQIEKELNRYGQQGWEVVSVICLPPASNGNDHSAMVMLKRPVNY